MRARGMCLCRRKCSSLWQDCCDGAHLPSGSALSTQVYEVRRLTGLRLAAGGDQIPQIVIGIVEQSLEGFLLDWRQRREMTLDKARKDEVQLEQPAPTLP